MEKTRLANHLAEIERDGYTVLEGAIEPEFNAAILKRVREIESATLGALEPGTREEDSSFLRTGGLLRLDLCVLRKPQQTGRTWFRKTRCKAVPGQ